MTLYSVSWEPNNLTGGWQKDASPTSLTLNSNQTSQERVLHDWLKHSVLGARVTKGLSRDCPACETHLHTKFTSNTSGIFRGQWFTCLQLFQVAQKLLHLLRLFELSSHWFMLQVYTCCGFFCWSRIPRLDTEDQNRVNRYQLLKRRGERGWRRRQRMRRTEEGRGGRQAFWI